MTLIEELQQKVNRLKSLLDDPQPGLFTWSDAVGRALTDLAKHAPEQRGTAREVAIVGPDPDDFCLCGPRRRIDGAGCVRCGKMIR